MVCSPRLPLLSVVGTAAALVSHGPFRGSRPAGPGGVQKSRGGLELMEASFHGDVPAYERFLPLCLGHLVKLIKALDASVSDAQLKVTLSHECLGPQLAGFKDKDACLKFAGMVDDARAEELKSDSMEGYHKACQFFWEHRSGAEAPNMTFPKPAGEGKAAPASGAKHDIGASKCRCVGINGAKGTTLVTVQGKKVTYPGDLGGHCEAWDQGNNPLCKGPNGEDWCKKKWCYVDPCDCDIVTAPKQSFYMPGARFQGKPLYYSYATCGDTDSFAPVNSNEAADVKKLCDAKQDPFKVGFEGCRCVGIAGQAGTTVVNAGLIMPAEVGASCEAWDENTHPDCKGDGKKPAWCGHKWCYVDPCECKLPDGNAPALSTYLPNGSFQNKPLYYSYATCHAGRPDLFTKNNNPDSCLNRKDKSECEVASASCAWTDGRCLGKELAGLC